MCENYEKPENGDKRNIEIRDYLEIDFRELVKITELKSMPTKYKVSNLDLSGQNEENIFTI